MSHSVLARIWQILVGRPDISNVLREITGSYTLSTIDTSVRRKRYLSYELFIWLKVIFDAQRSLIQDAPYLIDPQLLLAFLDFVIHLRKANWTDFGEELDEQALEWRSFSGRVLLSGLRAFQLRQTRISNHKKTDWLIKLDGWKTYGQDETELTFIQLCQEAIRNIPVSEEELDELKKVPTVIFPNWHAFKLRPNRAMSEKFAKALQSSKDSCGGEPFWALYDILGAVESAFISCCATNGEDVRSKDFVVSTRTKILEEMDKVAQDNKNISILKIGVFHWCRSGCECAKWASNGLMANTPVPMDSELHRMLEYLQSRDREVTHAESSFRQFGVTLYKKIQQWRGDEGNASGVESLDMTANSPEVVTYIVSCPEQHRVAAHILQALPVASSVRQDLKSFKEVVKFQPSAFCPKCHQLNSITRADRVTPLDEFWSIIRDLETKAPPQIPLPFLATWTDPPLANKLTASSTNSTTPDPIYSKNSSRSSSISAEPSDQAPDPTQGKKRRQSSIFSIRSKHSIAGSSRDTPPKKSSPASFRSWSSISADSRTLLLWEKNANDVLVCDMSTLSRNGTDSQRYMNSNRLLLDDVWFACAGTNKIACISGAKKRATDNSLKRITFFDKTSAKEETSLLLDTSDEGRLGPCAISRNDRFFGVVQGVNVLLYQISSIFQRDERPIFKVPFKFKEKQVGSQMINFSADSREIAAATRDGEGERHVIHLKVVTMQGDKHMEREFKISEKGILTSVQSFPGSNIAIVGVLESQNYNVLPDTRGSAGIHQWYAVHDIQSAATSQTGRHMIIARKDGTLYKYDINNPNSQGDLIAEVGCSSPRETKLYLKLGVADDDIIRGFWLDTSKGYHYFQVRSDRREFFQCHVDIVESEPRNLARPRTSSTVGS